MRLTIIGASGHGRVVADIAELVGYDDIAFLDDDPSLAEFDGHPVVGGSADLGRVAGDLFVAVGNARVRRQIMERETRRTFATLVHPRAVIASGARIGDGTVVMAGAVLNPGVTVGRGCIVNTCSSIDHDSVVGDYSHVSVGARLCGTVTVGEGVWVGAGATVSNNLSVASGATIGAGAVVIRGIREAGTYVGVPAERKGSQSKTLPSGRMQQADS